MNPRIIALRGRGGIGKTTTINLLVNEFLLPPDWIRESRKHHGNGVDIVDVYVNDNGIRLGVASAGDNFNEVKHALRRLVDARCTVIICACRTKDMPNAKGEYKGTHAAMKQFSHNIRFVRKRIVEENHKIRRHEANMNNAEQLLALV